MSERKFKTYKTMVERFRTMDLKKSGRLATFLLETFVLGNSKIYADGVENAGLLEPGEIFKEWRKRLVSRNIIIFEFNERDPNKSIHYPGFEIVDLINKEKEIRFPLATEKYVNEKISALELELKKTRLCVEKIIETTDPPCTEEKYNKFIEDPCSNLKPKKIDLSKFREKYQKDSEDDLEFIKTLNINEE